MLIVGIGGSATSPAAASTTNQLLLRCLEHAAERGARTAAVTGEELRDLPIYGAGPAGEGAGRFVDTVRRADCLVIATPGYHGGMSGLVKNALDHLEALRDEPRPYLDGRAVGAIVGAAGWQAAGTALVSVRSAIHALRGWPTPFGVTVNTSEQVNGAGEFDATVDDALAILAGQLVEFATWRAGG